MRYPRFMIKVEEKEIQIGYHLCTYTSRIFCRRVELFLFPVSRFKESVQLRARQKHRGKYSPKVFHSQVPRPSRQAWHLEFEFSLSHIMSSRAAGIIYNKTLPQKQMCT